MTPRILIATLLGLTLAACSPSAGDDAGTRDSGRRDTGIRRDGFVPMCGELGNFCCSASPSCASGARCGRDGRCCATPGGARCGREEDCCEAFQCVGGSCCSPAGSACRSPSDCCNDLLCSAGFCEMVAGDCGRMGETCCADDTCRSGLVCAGGSCIPCGALGDVCCKPPKPCGDTMVCTDGRCASPTGCGGDGQSCCAGNTCTGALECTSGRCGPPMGGDCSYTTCGDCTANYPCGWCAGTSRCTTGTSAGPDTGSCSDWDWFPSHCGGGTTTCSGATCDSCTASLGCGWCGASSTCMAGTSTGPTSGSCADWKWLSVDCSGTSTTCTRHSDCTSCTGEYPCGWCGDTRRCVSGSSTGPASGSCAPWAWLASACTAADPCAGATGCGDCTGRAECGWCASSSRCLVGGPSGPDAGSCADWDYTASDCSCGMLAATCGVDSDCCGSLACRRGVSFGVRCCVERSGACTFPSDCCGYMNCVGGSCECRAAGRACIDSRDCCTGTCSGGLCT